MTLSELSDDRKIEMVDKKQKRKTSPEQKKAYTVSPPDDPASLAVNPLISQVPITVIQSIITDPVVSAPDLRTLSTGV